MNSVDQMGGLALRSVGRGYGDRYKLVMSKHTGRINGN